MYNLKEMVINNKRVKFIYYKNHELWYVTETGFEFPVQIEDIGDGTFLAEDKALLFMRYIKKHIKFLEEASKVWVPHETGTDNPIDFPPVRCSCDRAGGALGGCLVHDIQKEEPGIDVPYQDDYT